MMRRAAAESGTRVREVVIRPNSAPQIKGIFLGACARQPHPGNDLGDLFAARGAG